jgi:O-antigen/teichoic acid export membrane protein
MKKIKKNNLDKKNFVWNLIGVSLNSFNSLFFLIAVKWINGINEAGIFTYAFAICCLFFFISTYFNRTYQISDYKEKYSFNQYFTVRVTMSILSIVLLLAFSFISKFDVFKIKVIMSIMIFRSIEAIADVFFGGLQKNDELYKVGISYSIKAILGLLFLIIIDILTHNIILSVLSLSFINILVLFLYDIKEYKKITKEKIKLDFSKSKLLLNSCFSVFIFSFLQTYLLNCQKYVITYFVSNDIQTIFGILIMPATILSLASIYLVMPYVNKLTNKYVEKNEKEFNKISKKIFLSLFVFGIVCIIIAYYIGIPVLNLIYGVNINEYKLLLIIILIASIFSAEATIISNLLTIRRINKVQSIIYFITSIISTTIAYFLIINKGITGAVYSYLISFIILLLFMIIIYILSFKKSLILEDK